MAGTLNRRLLLSGALALGSGALFAKRLSAAMRKADQGAAIRSLLDNYVFRGVFPGAAGSLGMATGPAAFFQAGTLARDSDRPVDADSLFRVMSMTKPIIGMAVMLLVEDGKIALDQDIADFIPAFAKTRVLIDPEKSMESRPAARPITIRTLLTHSSGLGYFSRVKGPLRDEYIRLGLLPVRMQRGGMLPGIGAFEYPPDLAAFADRLASLPLLAEPGSRWIYSVGADLAGRIIEVASAMPLDRFLSARIFGPLGMRSSFFTVPKEDSGRLTSLYAMREGVAVLDDPGPTSICLDPPPFLFGGSGLITSPRDYDRFLLMLAGEGAIGQRRIMRRETARAAMSDLLPAEADRRDLRSVGGGFGAFGAVALAALPDGRGKGTFGWYGGAGTVGFVDRANGLRAAGYSQYTPVDALPFREEYVAAVYGTSVR